MATALIAPMFKATLVGVGKPSTKSPIGIISYRSTTGQVKQCEVYSTFWGNASTQPDKAQIFQHLVHTGYGLIRKDSVKYASLI